MPKSAAHKAALNHANPSTRLEQPNLLEQEVSKQRGQPKASSNTVPISDNTIPSRNQETQNSSILQEPANTTNENGINRKKQKRRLKQAARLAAEQSQSVGNRRTQELPNDRASKYHGVAYDPSNSRVAIPPHRYDYGDLDFEGQDEYEPGEGEDQYYTDEEGRLYPQSYVSSQPPPNAQIANQYAPPGHASHSPRRKKTPESRRDSRQDYQVSYSGSGLPMSPTSGVQPPTPPPPPPALSPAALHSAHTISRDRIWDTSTAEERERIKDFWLHLGESDRRSLVKVEKEAVLKKMKEQQKHSCSCTVCGRKRTAIEEELEVLYDAYYEELEQYANHQQPVLDHGAPVMSPPKAYNHPMSRISSSNMHAPLRQSRSSRGRIHDLEDGEEDGEELSDEVDEDFSEDDYDDASRGPKDNFFNFGNSLTVQGGILTVADDLLKNDGKKFIEMMEQLAERRMQREEEAQYAATSVGQPSAQSLNHGPLVDDEDYDDEDDEEYDSQEDDEYDEEDEIEQMTEEQRMEEGRRMFQIFAARMFEQRVLTAYREKVAAERQQKLIEELEEESRLDTQREAKKAKEAQKKKEKKRQQKQIKEEEKAKREAEKAAEEAAARAIEEQKLEEIRQKKEEQRKRKEAERKAQDEERQKKEAEKQKRLQEAREQQAEQERKQKEQKEREKKKREDNKRREREVAEAKERDMKERKEHEAVEKIGRGFQQQAGKESKGRTIKEETVNTESTPTNAAASPAMKRKTSMAPVLPGFQSSQTPSTHASPHFQIATPVLPKAPTPVRARQTSFQDSNNISKVSQAPDDSATSSSLSTPQQSDMAPPPPPVRPVARPPSSQTSQPESVPSGVLPGMAPQSFSSFQSLPSTSNSGFLPSQAHGVSSMGRPPGHEASMFSQQYMSTGAPYQSYIASNGTSYAPIVNGTRQVPQSHAPQVENSTVQPQQLPAYAGNPTVSPRRGGVRDTMPTHSHSRNASTSLDKPIFDPHFAQSSNPIARPAPIQRPSSATKLHQADDQRPSTDFDIDELSKHLGSSALIDNTAEIPLSSKNSPRGSVGLRSERLGFGATPIYHEPIGSSKVDSFRRGSQSIGGERWAMSSMPFGNSSSGPLPWSNATGPGWQANHGFGVIGGPNRANVSRHVTVRLLASQACKHLAASNSIKADDGFIHMDAVLHQIERMKPSNENPIQLEEVIEICDTEGNQQNGGGFFTLRKDNQRGVLVRFDLGGTKQGDGRSGIAPGEIGGPMPGNGHGAFSFGGSHLGNRHFHPSDLTSPSGL